MWKKEGHEHTSGVSKKVFEFMPSGTSENALLADKHYTHQ